VETLTVNKTDVCSLTAVTTREVAKTKNGIEGTCSKFSAL